MNIIIFCAAGLSSGALVGNMKRVADPADTIEAHEFPEFERFADKADVILLSPGLGFKKRVVKAFCEPRKIAWGFIEPIYYGRMMGESVYAQAKKLYNELREE